MGATKTSAYSSRPYATLEPRVTKVSEAVIRKKWKKLPEFSQVRLAQLLDGVARQGLAKVAKKRNPKQAINDLERRDEGEVAVAELAGRLTKRLPRMPFPPKTDERDFDFEGTLHRVRTLENQLTSNVHSVALLKEQIRKEEDALRKDKDDLRVLEQSAKGARGLRKEQSKKLHILAREQPVDLNATEDTAMEAPPLQLGLETDHDARILVDQLRSHLESIRNNTAGVKDIVDLMDVVQAKLDTFTATALAPRQVKNAVSNDETSNDAMKD